MAKRVLVGSMGAVNRQWGFTDYAVEVMVLVRLILFIL